MQQAVLNNKSEVCNKKVKGVNFPRELVNEKIKEYEEDGNSFNMHNIYAIQYARTTTDRKINLEFGLNSFALFSKNSKISI